MKSRDMAVAVALAMVAAPLCAGEPPSAGSPLQAGDRIRIRSSAIPKTTVGQVVEAGPDVLKVLLADRSHPIEVPLSSVTRLQRSLGKRRDVGKFALIGALVGAGTGAAFVAIAGAAAGGCEGPCAPWAVLFAGMGGGAGTLAGAIAGAVKAERWEAVPSGRVGLSVVPERGGVGLRFAMRF